MGWVSGLESVLNVSSWVVGTIGDWKMESMDFSRNNVERLTSHEVLIKAKVKKIKVILPEVIDYAILLYT